MKKFGVFVLGIQLISVLLIEPAKAASLTNANGDCDVQLSGEIIAGDLTNLQASGLRYGQTLCLNSPGGNFSEGMKIANWIEGRNITTKLPAMSECYSSCALIFMAGSEFEEIYMSRRMMHRTANLGFHAPYMDLPEGSFNEKAVKNAYAHGLQSIAAMMELGAIIERGDPGFIPPRVILELLRRGPDDFYMIDTVFRARELDIEVVGALKPEWNVASLCNACKNHFNGHARDDICDTARVEIRRDGLAETLFFGVGGEGAYYCATRVEVSQEGRVTGKIHSFPLVDSDFPLKSEDFEILSADMALSAERALGH